MQIITEVQSISDLQILSLFCIMLPFHGMTLFGVTSPCLASRYAGTDHIFLAFLSPIRLLHDHYTK